MKRIRLFIGSSTEALPIARAVKAALERQVSEALKDNIEVDLWSEIFDPGQYTMESIEDRAQTCDFAVMIFAPDDVVMSRGVTKLAPRDNVLAELGLFIGYLGRDRAFLLLDADEVVSLPSDLRGITFETYRKRDDNKYEAAVAAACDHFLAAIAKYGRLRHTNPDFEKNLRTILQNCRSAFKVDHWAFENTLHGWVNSFKTDSEDFGRGILKIKIDYGLFLTEMYKKATAEIFSTTIPEYLKVWDSPMGKWLLKCQKENKQAHSSRIFVFANEKEITTDAMRVMRCHAENKIEVRVFIDDEDPSFSYTAHRVESDWTFIDGGTAIGVTIEIGRKGGRSTEAHWFFADPVKIAEYKRMKELLYVCAVGGFPSRARRMILAHVAHFLSYSGMPTPPGVEAGQPNPNPAIVEIVRSPCRMRPSRWSVRLFASGLHVEVEQALALSRDGKVQSVFAFFKGKAQVS